MREVEIDGIKLRVQDEDLDMDDAKDAAKATPKGPAPVVQGATSQPVDWDHTSE